MNRNRVAILIPCYNEEKTIGKVVSDFLSVCPDAVIYVYDNNSTDNTAEIAKKTGAIVRREYQQGKGNVVRRMFREIEADCYIMVDGDDTYPAEYAPEMINAVLNRNVDMVVGDRLSSTYYTENKRPFHNFGNAIVKSAVNGLFRCDFKDIMTGYRAFSYQFAKSFPVTSKGFEIETEMTIHAADNNMSVENVVIEYRDRPEDSFSKLNTYKDGFKVIKTLIKMFRDYKPYVFFCLISAVLLLLAIVFIMPILVDYVKTGMVDRFPTLIVCGFTCVVAILSYFTGLVLQVSHRNNRRSFEMLLHQIEQRKRGQEHETKSNG